MTEAQPPPAPPQEPPPPPEPPVDPEKAALEEIDRLLEAEDPDFKNQMEEMRTVEFDKNVNIEASAIDESASGDDKSDDKLPDRLPWRARFKAWLRAGVRGFRLRLQEAMVQAGKGIWIFLRTRPKEFFLYSLAVLKAVGHRIMVPIHAYEHASRLQRLLVWTLTALAVGAVSVFVANFKGIWLPRLDEPLLHSFADEADWVESFAGEDGAESFYAAFPQERHEFLFPKIKVNLRASEGHPNPMGAFEIIVQLDSKDTAIEVSDREVEFFDLLQRTIEEENFTDMEADIGKGRFKSRLKREFNQKLTQGWVKEINFKTFILKP